MRQDNYSFPNFTLQKQGAYENMKNQLEAEHESLLQERNNLENRRNNDRRPSQQFQNTKKTQSAFFEEAQAGLRISPVRHTNASPSIKDKIREIIRICNAESNNSESNNYREIAEAQQHILTYLENNFQSNNNISSLKFNTQQSLGTPHKLPQIRQELTSKGYRHSLGDDAMEMIEQIERKALAEIDSLRHNKIQLLKKLNEEIQGHNEQKKLRMQLEEELDFLVEELRKVGSKRSNQVLSKIMSNRQQRQQPQFRPSNNSQRPSQRQQQQQPQFYDEEVSRPVLNDVNEIQSQYQKNYQNKNNKSFNNNLSHFANAKRPSHQQEAFAQQQIALLQNQNSRIQEMLRGQQGSSGDQLKSQLRAELRALTEKIRNYENIISQHRNSHGTSQSGQIEALLAEGSYLSQNGQKLRQSRAMTAGTDGKRQDFIKEMQYLKEKIFNLESQNENLSKRARLTFEPKPTNFYSKTYTPKAGSFSPSKFEGIIDEMKRVTNL